MLELTILYNPNTGSCEVRGIPVIEDVQGTQTVHKGLCYAALGVARDLIREFKVGEKKTPILLANRIPGLNGGPK